LVRRSAVSVDAAAALPKSIGSFVARDLGNVPVAGIRDHTVWWIGIGHAGTLISLRCSLRQSWRINRFAK
jgi:hypothetical protein